MVNLVFSEWIQGLPHSIMREKEFCQMKEIQRFTMRFAVAILFIFTMLSPLSSVAHAEINVVNTQTDEAKIKTAIEKVSNYILSEGVESEWEAIGLAKAGKSIPIQYHQKFEEHLQNQVISKSGNGRMKITDVERLLLAAIAIGKDPTNIDGKGFNLVEKIYNSEAWTTGADSLTFQGNNGIIFALLALDANAFNVPNEAKWTREKLVAELLKYQKADGSWSLTTSTEGKTSFDITAMALAALAPYDGQSNVKNAIQKAVTFLSNAQESTGGYDDDFAGGISSEATSQVIIGLTSNGMNPESTLFTKQGTNLIDHLLSFQSTDGGFKHTKGDRASNNMATEQALQALVAFDLYVNDGGALYDFTEEEIVPPAITFTDTKGHWAEKDIQKAVQYGIMKGYANGTFKPENQLTRAQAASILVRALDLETNQTAPFTDIEGYAKDTQAEIAAAYQHGIIKGYQGNFNPGNKVTRSQLALMLYRAYESQVGEHYIASALAPFKDIENYDKETQDAISMIYELKIAQGSNGLYLPGNPTKRSHAAKMLVTYMEFLEK